MKEYNLEKEVGFKCDTWPAKNVAEIRPFPEECWEILRTLDLKPLTGMYQGFNLDPLILVLPFLISRGVLLKLYCREEFSLRMCPQSAFSLF